MLSCIHKPNQEKVMKGLVFDRSIGWAYEPSFDHHFDGDEDCITEESCDCIDEGCDEHSSEV